MLWSLVKSFRRPGGFLWQALRARWISGMLVTAPESSVPRAQGCRAVCRRPVAAGDGGAGGRLLRHAGAWLSQHVPLLGPGQLCPCTVIHLCHTLTGEDPVCFSRKAGVKGDRPCRSQSG